MKRKPTVSVVDAMLILRIALMTRGRRRDERILVELLALQEHPRCRSYMTRKRMEPIARLS